MSKFHVFDTSIAEKYGVNAAILLYNIANWIEKNQANDRNYKDGNYWTYNSIKAFKEQFPYMSEKVIRSALQKLIDGGVILTGNYNKSAYDRTIWYALTEKGKSICLFGKMETVERENGNLQKGEPIPDINTNNRPNNIEDTNVSSCSEAKQVCSEPPIVEIVLNDGSMQSIYQNDVDAYKTYYPAIDVVAELRKAAAWCYSNPANRKTKRGVSRFINGWLSRAQDKAPKVVDTGEKEYF